MPAGALAGHHVRRRPPRRDHRRARAAAGDPEYLILQPDGGGGGDLSYDQEFWVHPLPPPGPVTLIASWPLQGITETRAELDGAAIGQAAQCAVTLWRDEPDTL